MPGKGVLQSEKTASSGDSSYFNVGANLDDSYAQVLSASRAQVPVSVANGQNTGRGAHYIEESPQLSRFPSGESDTEDGSGITHLMVQGMVRRLSDVAASDSEEESNDAIKVTVKLDRVKEPSSIQATNLLQNIVTSYYSIQHVARNIFGIAIPSISNLWMITLHTSAALYKVGAVAASYESRDLAPNYKEMLIKVLPTAVYLVKIGISEVIAKPMMESFLTAKNADQLCAAHAATQFAVDRLGDTVHLFVERSSEPTSILYGTAYTAIHCVGKDNTELGYYEGVASSALSLLSGALVSTYLYHTLPVDYTKFEVLNNVIKTISSVAVVNKLVNALFAATATQSDAMVTGNMLNNSILVANIARGKNLQNNANSAIKKEGASNGVLEDVINSSSSVADIAHIDGLQDDAVTLISFAEFYMAEVAGSCKIGDIE